MAAMQSGQLPRWRAVGRPAGPDAPTRCRLQFLLLLACMQSSTAQRAFQLSTATCTLTADATNCQVAQAGDAALRVVFNAAAAQGVETSLTLDMSAATTCSATSEFCPQVFLVTSDNVANIVKILKCSYYRQADYSSHLLTYTFVNVGDKNPFVIKDGHDFSRAVVPPGAVRECICYCAGTCSTETNNRLHCPNA
eukprot:CAMPEP_0170587268 /NCGR_PEP_ID=MMETSP0224-20130122/10194_1 /TAXON_ID=285029 /ORGANISM="Togula jolla, Strain CCCM 725" /LENGTH=194 /DNA_ID=CAMNT_0010910883 /DNA_START=12 /DNA_END=593 /DNA_ORIENTATION=+